MKTLRAYLTSCVLLASATGLSGCATTRSGDAAAHEPAGAEEQLQAAEAIQRDVNPEFTEAADSSGLCFTTFYVGFRSPKRMCNQCHPAKPL